MIDFVKSALPFAIIGIGVAICSSNFGKKGEDIDNYLTEGMCLGMCLGVVFSSSLQIDLGLGISLFIF